MVELTDKLREFKNKEILVNLIGGGYSPKGILHVVDEKWIRVGDRIIPISAISNFKLARYGELQ